MKNNFLKLSVFLLIFIVAGLFGFLVFVSFIEAQDDSEWILKYPMPTARSGATGGVIDGKIYVAGGAKANGQASADLEIYNSVADSWEIGAQMAEPRWGLASGVIDGKYYVVMGGSPVPYGSVKTEEFDPATNQWIEKNNMPSPGWGVAAGVIDNKIYVIGGYNWFEKGMSWNREFDPATNQWTLKAPMPTRRSWLGAEVINDQLYVVGGWNWNDSVDLPTLEVYNPLSDSWTTKASMPVGLRNFATAVKDGKLYVFGGYTREGASAQRYSSVYIYDPEIDTWSRAKDIPALIDGAIAEVVDGNVYLVGGSTEYGASNTTYAWQSNKEPEPVIIVPGIMGSWYKHGEWVMDPILHTYDDLIEAMIQSGYVLDEDLFLFPYDWRNDNVITAGLLKEKINKVKMQTGREKVDVVAHSMGGLVSRYYVQSNEYEDDVDQLIFLGVPHKGSPSAYLIWEATEGFGSIKEKIAKIYLSIEAYLSGDNSLFDYIQNKIKSVEQLLPVYPYLQDVGFTQLRGYNQNLYPNNYPYNSFLESLNSEENLNKFSNSGVRVSNMVGDNGDNTIGAINVSSGELYHPMWEHGYMEEIIYVSGDQTVPHMSSSLFIPTTIEDTKHIQIPTNAQKQIIEYLIGQVPVVDINNIPELEEILVVAIYSPADFIVISPSGKRLGKDFLSNMSVNQIDYAFYTGFGDEPEFVTIINPEEGEYEVILQGTDNGVYRLGIDILGEETDSSSENLMTGVITIGEEESFSFYYEDNSEVSLIIQKEISTKGLAQDLNELYSIEEILEKQVYNYLSAHFKKLDNIYDKIQDKRNREKRKNDFIEEADKIIEKLEFYLNKNWITQTAYDIIENNIDSLIYELSLLQ